MYIDKNIPPSVCHVCTGQNIVYQRSMCACVCAETKTYINLPCVQVYKQKHQSTIPPRVRVYRQKHSLSVQCVYVCVHTHMHAVVYVI